MVVSVVTALDHIFTYFFFLRFFIVANIHLSTSKYNDRI